MNFFNLFSYDYKDEYKDERQLNYIFFDCKILHTIETDTGVKLNKGDKYEVIIYNFNTGKFKFGPKKTKNSNNYRNDDFGEYYSFIISGSELCGCNY
jgi:hypothetical protein